jgi:hypothetical protein
MTPLERYFKGLSKLLPAEQREDILRELSEDIRSEMEDKESELGHPLTEEEQLLILKRRGNPLKVAAGYTNNKGTLAFGPQLIGPVLFPFYTRVLRFNLGLTFVIVGAIFGALSLSGQPVRAGDLFSNVLLQLFVQLAAVTIIFMLVEKYLSHQPAEWDAREFEKTLQASIRDRIDKKIRLQMREVSRFDSISVLIASGVALLWIQSLWAKPFLIFGPAALVITFAPVWHRVYLPIVFIMLASIVRACINLAQPNWVRFRDFAALILDAAALAVVYILMFAHTWVVPVASLAADSGAQRYAATVNQWAPVGFWAAAVISLFQAIKDLIRFYKNWRWSGSTAR